MMIILSSSLARTTTRTSRSNLLFNNVLFCLRRHDTTTTSTTTTRIIKESITTTTTSTTTTAGGGGILLLPSSSSSLQQQQQQPSSIRRRRNNHHQQQQQQINKEEIMTTTTTTTSPLSTTTTGDVGGRDGGSGDDIIMGDGDGGGGAISETRRIITTTTTTTTGNNNNNHTTTTTRTVVPSFRYLSAWFCPFAHRATLALEHHYGRIQYEWIEALGWYQQEDKNNVTGTGKEWYYHWKADELKRVNPSALVPTLIPIKVVQQTNNNNNNSNVDDDHDDPNNVVLYYDEDHAIYESLICIDYIDTISDAVGTDRLVPVEDPYEVARCRLWCDKINRECCSPYYSILVRKDPQERYEHFMELINGLIHFSNELIKTDGPTFLSNGRLSNVDLTLIPWAYRYYVLEHYRGIEYAILSCREKYPELKPYYSWYDYVMNLESVKRTLPNQNQYLYHIRKYADGSARSKVANAVRRGVPAHELHDTKDEY